MSAASALQEPAAPRLGEGDALRASGRVLLCINSDRAHLPRTASVLQERSQGHHPLQESGDREMKCLCFIFNVLHFYLMLGGYR